MKNKYGWVSTQNIVVRKVLVEELLNCLFEKKEELPYFISDKTNLYDIWLDDEIEVIKRCKKHYGVSHNPELSIYETSSLRQEWDYLQEIHGYETLTPKGGYWYAN